MSRQTFIATTVVTVNAAFLQELKEVNEELWKLLALTRRQCGQDLASECLAKLVDLLHELRDQLALHFALEEAYGYFEDPLAVAPQLSEKAGRLREEHRSIYSDLCELVEQAEQLLGDQQIQHLLLWIGPRFESFDQWLMDHERRENALIMDAYDCDFGGGD